jgi:hypothetical protein
MEVISTGKGVGLVRFALHARKLHASRPNCVLPGAGQLCARIVSPPPAVGVLAPGFRRGAPVDLGVWGWVGVRSCSRSKGFVVVGC